MIHCPVQEVVEDPLRQTTANANVELGELYGVEPCGNDEIQISYPEIILWGM